ncbi:YdiU family protein [Nocardioides sp. TRM66260-LWL]|uniref:protein adenylyltransferase SelO n=1 Tax=Nocardioides sp. TRM66260-LWL TaxID=2874478 RepID=UPI001CC4C317|nr:YdiU family protein [Nocardioides sp. TRM66260-LWL]MBZ5734703.1 YdiU family protein [Nocardioides sp. TRM66260-LWL]
MTATVSLSHRFADLLPEMAVPVRAADAPDPRLVVLDEAVAADLGLDAGWLRSDEGLGLLTGTRVPDGARPVAQAYAGHQFGGFARLGDGRALLLGELRDRDGRLRDLHLKGSGRTPFARGGDGLAALGPMLREVVISESMHALGIPTTRALAVVVTGRAVQREQPLPGAVLARVASSHLRVGSVQFARATDDRGLLERVVALAIERHHPEAEGALGLYRAVIAAQADLIARWMLVGFVHGVMNTDNMTLSGETIDYGPCAFLDAYDPATVFSSIDHDGRYAYRNQPGIAMWNLARLGEALLPLLADDEPTAIERATEALHGFGPRYEAALAAGHRAKLGLAHAPSADVDPLVAEVLGLMEAARVDHTRFWRDLAEAARGDAEAVRGVVLDLPALDAWLDRWRALGPDAAAMDAVNPLHIPRNHLVDEALRAAETDANLEPLHRLLEAVRSPYVAVPGLEAYAAAAPDAGPFVTYCGT